MNVRCLKRLSCSESAARLVLGRLVADHIVFPTLDPLYVAVAKNDVAPGSAMIIVPIRVVIDRSGSLTIPVKDQPDLGGTNHLASQPKDGVFMNVAGRDRKSTRLNSSHGYISYAVFCLK